MADAAADHYDEVPYPCLVHPHAHPRHVGALGALFGVPAAAPAGARVLELGCASATQLIAFAFDHPDAHCVGVDASARQIDAGRVRAAQLGLTNVSLVCKVFGEWDAEAGDATFDYVIAHGILSWVAPATQDALLAIMRRRLAPNGLAYLSFNAMPGWAFGTLVRDLMLRGTAGSFAPSASRAREGRRWLTQAARDAEAGTLLSATLIAEAAHITDHDDAYLEHEYFEAEHHPFWLADVVSRARQHGLAYVTDADPGLVLPSTQVSSVQRAVAGMADPVACQQAIDALTNTRFRRAILTRAEDADGLGLTLAPATLARLHLALPHARALNDGSGGGTPTVRDGRDTPLPLRDGALVAALVALREAWPATLPFTEIVPTFDAGAPAARALAGGLIGLVFAGALKLTLAPVSPLSGAVPERPRVSPLVLAQAAAGEPIASHWFISQNIGDPVRRLVLGLDGTRTPDALAATSGLAIGEVVLRLEVLLRLGFLER